MHCSYPTTARAARERQCAVRRSLLLLAVIAGAGVDPVWQNP